jgi:hypothetical protein
MFVPKKTMYSFFFLGEGPERVLEAIETCAHCRGIHCLYYQLGGCHHPERTEE